VDVRVTGHQVDVGNSLQEQSSSRMQAIADKYFSRAVAANVTFSPGPHADFICDIVAPVAQGVVLKAHHRAQEANIAFEAAADKIEKQLSRYAKRLREHKAEPISEIIDNAGYTVLSSTMRATPSSRPHRKRMTKIRRIRRSSPRLGSTFRKPAFPTRSCCSTFATRLH
jgi:ribosomal subunit interface protein